MEQKQTTKMPTPEELEAMMVVPAWLVHGTAFLLQVIVYGLPVVAIALPVMHSPALWFTIVWLMIAPVVYAFLFALTAGMCSLPWQRGIIKGVFPRDVRFPIYAMRKLYGTCWTAVYYFKPIYTIILNVSLFKAIVFRLFGYRGSLNIALYPDAWIRDLPLLRIEEGVYISNLCALGSNVSLIAGATMVGNITIKKGALVGAVSKIGLGTTVGEQTEISIEVITGLHVKIGNENFIGARTEISHYAKIGNNNQIGVSCFIGTSAVIGDNLNIPNNTRIPDKAQVYTQADVLKYVQPAPATTNGIYQKIIEKKPH